MMINTDTLKNLDVTDVYAIDAAQDGARQTGVLIGALGEKVAAFVNLGYTKLQRGVIYDLENAVHDGDRVYMDDETTIHRLVYA